ncbi:Potassium channel [Mortierella alpina]|nr:Potassium channel [Mortierella alpina]
MVAFSSSPDQSDSRSCTPYSVSDHGSGRGGGRGGGPGTSNNKPEASSTYSSSTYSTPPSETDTEPRAHPKLVKAGPYLTVAALQAYTILTVVRCLADPTWIVLKTNDDKSGGRENKINLGMIGTVERWCLSFAIAFTLLSCLGVTLRIMDKMAWLRRVPVVCAYFQVLFCITAMSSFLHTQHLPPGAQYSHGFLACAITVVFSSIVAIMLTVDWWRGFPCAGLSATLKALIVSSFMMTIVIIVGAALYTWLEGWTFDEAVNFCIVSFSTIGYGNLSPKSVAGRIVFFIYGIFGISSIAFFIMSLRNAVIEQFQWRLVQRFALPSHLTRVQTRMSAKDLSYPVARFEEEQRVKKVVKRKMIVRMLSIWIVLWFGGAGVFCAFEKWSFLESLYFCYVTLTTIGFGDYVPSEPGSIEFWNIYVFIGLTIFAYILSLFSESMAAHIHLVDDEIVDEDDDMYGWEQCEDPSNNNGPQFSYRTGLIGMDGLKWIENQQQIHPYQEMQELSANSGAVAAASVLSQPEQEQNKPDDDHGDHHHRLLHPLLHRPSLSLRFWSQARVQPEASENSAHQQKRQQCQLQQQTQQQQQQQQRPHHMARKSSTGRVLMIPARERQQMLQAEYYATHNGPPMGFQLSDNPVNPANSNVNTNLTDRMATGTTSQGHLTESNGAQYGGDMARMSIIAPTTIRFVDINGVPHHRTIHGNRRSQILAAAHNRHSYSGSIGSASGSLAPGQQGDGSRETSPHPPYQQPYVPSGGGYIIGTEGYQEMMAQRRRRRRDTLASAGHLVSSSLPRSSLSMGHLGGEGETLNGVGAGETHQLHDAPPPPLGTSLSYGGGTTMETPRPQLHRSCFSQNPQVLQTSALDHQPQVKFESPGASPRSEATTGNNPSPRHLPEAHLYHGRSQIHHNSRDSSSPPPSLHEHRSSPFTLGESLSPYKDYGVYKMPWPGEEAGGEAEESKHRMLASRFDPSHGHQDDDDGEGLDHEEDEHGDHHHHHHHHDPSLAEADAYRRFMELTHTRQSNASDATKVASPTEVSGSGRHHHYHHHESPQYLPHPQQLQPQQQQQQQEPPHQPQLDSYFTDASMSRPNEKESSPPWRREGIAPDEVVPPYPVSASIDESITSVGPLDARSPLVRDDGSRATPLHVLLPPPLSLPSRRPLLQQLQPISREHDDAIDNTSRLANVARTNSSNHIRHSNDNINNDDNNNNGRTSSRNESLGPLDEVRSPDTIPSFEVDVDLNHLDPDPVQVREAQRNRADLFRRRDDIEKRQFSPPPPSPSPPQ